LFLASRARRKAHPLLSSGLTRPAWWRYQGDPVVERALRIMHERPAHPWTMDRLATQSGASRATLARRFKEVVGESPMAFLRNWRMAMAADLLCRPGETVGSVAEKVGYATPFAFSAAFKRARGIWPQEHRDSVRSHSENVPLGTSGRPRHTGR